MPTERPFLRDALTASAAALAVVAAHLLIPPAALPTATVAEASAALGALLDAGRADAGAPGSPGPFLTRVYDVRDLLRGPVELQAILGRVDSPGDQVPFGPFWMKADESVRDGEARKLFDLIGRLDPQPAGPVRHWAEPAAGRVVIEHTAAGHARVAAVLAALRLAERARPGGGR